MSVREGRYLYTAVLIFCAELCLALISAPLGMRLLAGLLALYYATKACTDRTGSGHPIGLYMTVSGLYVFAALTEVALFGNRMGLNTSLMGALADMGVGFLIFAAIGFLIFREKPGSTTRIPSADQYMVLAAISVCTVLFILSATLVFARYGLSIGTMSRAALYSDENALLTFLRSLLAIALGVAAAVLVGYESRNGVFVPARIQLFATLAGYALVDLLILGDRRLPLMAFLAVGVNYMPKKFTAAQIVSAVVMTVVLFVYGFIRNTPTSGWLDVVTSRSMFLAFSPASSEFGGLAIIGQAIGDFNHPAPGFPNYLDSILQVLPRAILPDRPISPTEWFVQSYFPSYAAMGASFAFNQVVEARLNLGVFGIGLIGLITGSAIAFVSRLRYFGLPVGLPIAVYAFTFSMRMDFASILRTGIGAAIGASIVLLVVTAMAVVMERGRRRR